MAKRPILKRRSITEQVGYGQPPHHSRFKKGRSGNPRGRPKGSRNLKSIIVKRLFSLVDVRENGKSRRIPMLEAIVVKSSNDALQGRQKAFIDIFKLLQGANLFSLEELDQPTAGYPLNSVVTARVIRPGSTLAETSHKALDAKERSGFYSASPENEPPLAKSLVQTRNRKHKLR